MNRMSPRFHPLAFAASAVGLKYRAIAYKQTTDAEALTMAAALGAVDRGPGVARFELGAVALVLPRRARTANCDALQPVF